MNDALFLHRIHFAFTITFHYLFPQLTMGLAPLIVVLKTLAIRTGNEAYNESARFWTKIFGINFALGVVTGIAMEFQFGTNWAQFSRLPGVGVPGAVPVRRKAPGEMGALVGGFPGVPRLMALRVLHHRDRRVDAASSGLHAPA